jgi:hypothetical protein
MQIYQAPSQTKKQSPYMGIGACISHMPPSNQRYVTCALAAIALTFASSTFALEGLGDPRPQWEGWKAEIGDGACWITAEYRPYGWFEDRQPHATLSLMSVSFVSVAHPDKNAEFGFERDFGVSSPAVMVSFYKSPTLEGWVDPVRVRVADNELFWRKPPAPENFRFAAIGWTASRVWMTLANETFPSVEVFTADGRRNVVSISARNFAPAGAMLKACVETLRNEDSANRIAP